MHFSHVAEPAKVLAWWLLLCGITSVSSRAQGQFYFNNRDLTSGVNARFINQLSGAAEGAERSSVGLPDWSVQLFRQSNAGELLPLDPPGTAFRGPPWSATAGYVVPVTVTVPGVPIGKAPTFWSAYWDQETSSRTSDRFKYPPAYSDEIGHLFRSNSDSIPMISDSHRSEATLRRL